MINSSIIPFLEIFFTHSFYKDTKMPVTIFPLGTTKGIMLKMGLFFKATPNGFILGYTPNKTEAYFEEGITSIPLIFVVKNENPLFQNITEINPYDPTKQTFLFNDLSNGPIKMNGIVANDNLIEINDEELYKDDIKDLQIGLEGNHFGIIHFGLTKQMLIMQEGKKEIQWKHPIVFSSRRVFYRYFLVNKKEAFKDIKIKYQGENIPNIVQKEAQLSNGRHALCLKLPVKFSILEHYAELPKLELLTTSGNNITITLPTPNLNAIKFIEEAGSRKVYADMYVYL